MAFIRMVAVYKENGIINEDWKVILLCNVDEQFYITDGEWFGYVKDCDHIYPFVLQKTSVLFYGGDEHSYETSNLDNRQIVVGNYFSVFSSPDESEHIESAYEIASVHNF